MEILLELSTRLGQKKMKVFTSGVVMLGDTFI